MIDGRNFEEGRNWGKRKPAIGVRILSNTAFVEGGDDTFAFHSRIYEGQILGLSRTKIQEGKKPVRFGRFGGGESQRQTLYRRKKTLDALNSKGQKREGNFGGEKSKEHDQIKRG